MAHELSRAGTNVLMGVLALALPSAAASGCLGAPLFSTDDDDTTSVEVPPWEDDCAGFGAGSTGSGTNEAPPPPPSVDASAVISEADILEVDGDHIYALSQFFGMTVVDASSPDNLVVLGNYKPSGTGFEMYVEDGVVFLMTTGDAFGTARIEAVNATNPENLAGMGQVSVPGEISDSRIVGDVLYVVSLAAETYGGSRTVVTSVSVANPTALAQVDQHEFAQSDPDDFGWKRSVYATDERLYVAGVEWDGVSNDGHSTIHVVDISDGTGQMEPGATVDPAGQIYSRWQMDEYEGVLRVVTQPGIFSDEDVPKVETFTVASSTEITTLGYTEMVLPVPEALRAVRFDGDTAYVITAALSEPWDPNPTPPPPSTFFGDPLFVIDFADPSAPLQRGELEIPGWVYHMEVRGDRILALGFDGNDPEGMINVSLFDVADPDAPTMLARESFGGQYSGVVEDQNRIHKAFTVLDDLGLIVVPYGDFDEFNSSDPCFGPWTDFQHFGALQLIDFDRESLTQRGTATMWSQTRRALVHRERLIGMSDDELRVFDISDRDAPSETNDVPLYQ